MPSRPRQTLVYVRWLDASYQRGECALADMVPRVEVESAGILVSEDEETISLALDYYAVEQTWRSIEHIPKVLVLRVRRFTV